jgi:predicted small secreted protein
MRRLRPWILWALLLALCVAGFGCNTIRGAGQDLERAGEAIQHAVE